uniref:Uncharacterized protein n=1 Tax=Rhizophora mucronata TaxID=61149 RepID=A0A2P2QKL4_RHIMU
MYSLPEFLAQKITRSTKKSPRI